MIFVKNQMDIAVMKTWHEFDPIANLKNARREIIVFQVWFAKSV